MGAAWELEQIGSKLSDTEIDEIGAVDAVPALIQALKDQNKYVRVFAVLALGEIGTPDALKAVEEYQSRQ